MGSGIIRNWYLTLELRQEIPQYAILNTDSTPIIMSLITTLQETLRQQGMLPFVEYMHQALYAPQWGYYSSGLPKLGKQGDFTTAPELTSLFGHTLAHQCAQVLKVLSTPILFEFGAGTGKLCIDLLTHLEQLNQLPIQYQILEVSAHLKHQQQENIVRHIPHLASRVSWLNTWPTETIEGVMIANEVLDAMPVHRFMQTEHDILESFITLDKENALQEIFKPCTDERLLTYLKNALPTDLFPYLSEANLMLEGWFLQASNMLERGAFFLLDYGFPRHEYYHPDRHQGTLMCHYQHHAHTNPLAHPGEEDITTHVDFTHVAEAASHAGFHVAGFTNQASFLLANGLLSLLGALEEGRHKIQETQAAKQLLQASEMGELFKVIALTKGLDLQLSGFQLQDKRASL